MRICILLGTVAASVGRGSWPMAGSRRCRGNPAGEVAETNSIGPLGRTIKPLGQPRGPLAARRGAQVGGSSKRSSAASCSASALELSALSSNFSSAFRRGAGGRYHSRPGRKDFPPAPDSADDGLPPPSPASRVHPCPRFGRRWFITSGPDTRASPCARFGRGWATTRCPDTRVSPCARPPTRRRHRHNPVQAWAGTSVFSWGRAS